MPGLRSSNRGTPRKRYTIDAFEGIEELASESGSSDEEIPDALDQDADDFEAGAEPSESDDDDAMSGIERELDNVSDKASNAGERDLDDSMSIASDPDTPAKKPGRKAKRLAIPEDQRLFTRGTPDNIHNRLTKKERRKYFFGTGEHDTDILMKARARWGAEICFPSRKANKSGAGGFSYSIAYEKAIAESQANWEWYKDDGGKKWFSQRQQISTMTEQDAQDYMPVDAPSERSFVMGAVNQQKLHTLKPREYLPLHEPFRKDPEPGQKWKEVRPAEYKSGFILNLGARVHCLDWAPHQPGSKQCLALTVLPTRPSDETPEAPAFAPHPQHLSSVQIWELSASATGHIDSIIPPKLSLVLSAEMGDIKVLKWCPVPTAGTTSLGLLAFLSYDGSIRVVDVTRSVGDSTSYRMIDAFAFESKPPDTVCTCMAWVDSHRLIAGCANGCVAVWDLAECMTKDNSNPRPSSYASVTTSYILAIATAWPSLPNMLMTTSAAGHTLLTDISRQFQDTSATAVAARVRVGHNTLAWLEHCKSALVVEDNLTLKAYPLRRWFSTIGLGKMRSSPTCIASSPCHPFVLLGSAGGEVFGNNPLRRIVDGGKIAMWQQDWFRHEWRRPSEQERKAAEQFGEKLQAADAIASDQQQAEDQAAVNKARFGNSGLARISEGFKAERISLDGKSSQNSKNGVLFKTIYEEKTAITALAWNPNLHVAGWAAAGMADGLLRIEDIAA
ncbi:Transcription factor tau subunit sfc6 [Pseudocercospora fuligena]|uniref:Transcription factor tau subunit sfc6 n=1 Tax=Pseudocercospora fuligena TaxID=685502 RepID=A0A8H6VIV9_9PEZI|nr:Transcription factor tau subunit sfc6 [Pseudocercospora fuligena]